MSDSHIKQNSGWRRFVPVLPAIGVALVPKIVCPLCWPAYAGLLSAFGISFLPTAPYLLPLTIGCLVISLMVLAWRSRQQRIIAPLVLGGFGASVILVGRFVFQSQAALFAGVAVLVGAFVWDVWLSRIRRATCPACVTTFVPLEELSANQKQQPSSESQNTTVDSIV